MLYYSGSEKQRHWSDCAGWSAPLLFAYGLSRFSCDMAHLVTWKFLCTLFSVCSMNSSQSIQGLLDVPICAVNDDGYFANPRYSLQFPPNQFNQKKLHRIPVNAINVNSQLHPINTVTGLQYFTGLNSYPFREKAIPRVGMGKYMCIFTLIFLPLPRSRTLKLKKL